MTLLAERRLGLVTGAPSRALRYLPLTALVVDMLIVAVTGLVASYSRDSLPVFADGVTSVADTLAVAGPLMIVGWLVAVALTGGYQKDVFGAGTDEYKRVVNASLLAAGLVGIGCYLARFELSRGFFLLAFALGIPGLVFGRFLLRRALSSARRHGALQQRVIIAGSPSHIDEVAAVLARESWLGYHVVGALTPSGDDVETAFGVPVLGIPDQATEIVGTIEADVVFFAGGALDSANDLRRIVWELEADDVQVVVAPSVTDISSERVKVRPVGGLPLMHIGKPRSIHASRWGKRAFDILGSLGALVVFAPLFLFAAVRIRLHDRGPVFFSQVRTGQGGGEFNCLKFRTMVPNAEDLLPELHAQTEYEVGLFKLKDDPRITLPGQWLRRFSLDELPQLINVLRGEMSLVGPRPPLPLEVANYQPDTVRRLRVRPGMTGLWQVSGRSDLSFSEAIRLDLFYVDNWSMMQDLTIMVRTLGAVFGKRGAY